MKCLKFVILECWPEPLIVNEQGTGQERALRAVVLAKISSRRHIVATTATSLAASSIYASHVSFCTFPFFFHVFSI